MKVKKHQNTDACTLYTFNYTGYPFLNITRAMEGLKLLICSDFSKLTGEVMLAATGQTFFSCLGMGCMITYASYLSKEENLVQVQP